MQRCGYGESDIYTQTGEGGSDRSAQRLKVQSEAKEEEEVKAQAVCAAMQPLGRKWLN
jgi:hypothetical protein